MNYFQAQEYMKTLDKRGIDLGLSRIKTLLKHLDNPEKNLKIIHVAGTNGKGSTANFIYQILLEAGYSVGLFTTPKLTKDQEMYRYNNQFISEDDYGRILSQLKKVIEKYQLKPTKFEVMTALALSFFHDKALDFAVIEVGMGGLEDATNAISNKCLSVITPIAMDHSDFLGDTIEDIAKVKAGIIKKNIPCITSNSKPSVVKVIKDYCEEQSSPFITVNTKAYQITSYNPGITFSYENKAYVTQMLGLYQIENAILAIESIKALKDFMDLSISNKSIAGGIEKAIWPGRFEVISKKPLIIIDGGHNKEGIAALRKSIERRFYPEDKLLGIFSMLGDKPVESACEIIMPLFESVIVTDVENDRRMSPEALMGIVKRYHDKVHYEALEELKQRVQHIEGYDGIIIFGSLYMIGAFKS